MNYKTHLFILLFLLLFTQHSSSQIKNSEAVFYNMAISSLFSCVGAVIHKKPNESLGKVMLNGVWKGALGGYFVYNSKKMIYKFSETGNYKYTWGSKLLNSLGNSMIYNGASNKSLLGKIYLNIGFNRLEFTTKNKFKFTYKILPVALYGTILAASRGSFNFKKSVQTGHFIFTNYKKNFGTSRALVNSILLKENSNKTLAHEIIHVYQYEDYFTINLFTPKIHKKLNNYSTFSKLNKWIYFDMHSFVLKGLYDIEKKGNKCYFDNFYENEANFYSDKFGCN